MSSYVDTAAPADGPAPLRNWRLALAIIAGGFVGSVLRAELAEQWPAHVGEWPWTTFAVNVLGALLLGFVATRMRDRIAQHHYRYRFAATGFCGGLTTFSTLQLELLHLLDAGSVLLAGAYLTTSCAAGLLAILAGSRLARGVEVPA